MPAFDPNAFDQNAFDAGTPGGSSYILAVGENPEDPDNNLKAFIRILVELLQEIEAVFQQLLTECGPLTAVGAQLDVQGALVGAKRQGLDDDTYRRRILAQISVNKSNGTINEILAIARLLLFDEAATLQFNNLGNAAYLLIVATEITEAMAQLVASFVQRGTAAGVRGTIQFGVSDPAGWFRLDSGPGLDVGHLTGQIG